jgi:hypothetical protein
MWFPVPEEARPDTAGRATGGPAVSSSSTRRRVIVALAPRHRRARAASSSAFAPGPAIARDQPLRAGGLPDLQA